MEDEIRWDLSKVTHSSSGTDPRRLWILWNPTQSILHSTEIQVPLGMTSIQFASSSEPLEATGRRRETPRLPYKGVTDYPKIPNQWLTGFATPTRFFRATGSLGLLSPGKSRHWPNLQQQLGISPAHVCISWRLYIPNETRELWNHLSHNALPGFLWWVVRFRWSSSKRKRQK